MRYTPPEKTEKIETGNKCHHRKETGDMYIYYYFLQRNNQRKTHLHLCFLRLSCCSVGDSICRRFK